MKVHLLILTLFLSTLGCAPNIVKKPCVIDGTLVTNAYINKSKIAYKEAGYSDEATEVYIKSAFWHCSIEE